MDDSILPVLRSHNAVRTLIGRGTSPDRPLFNLPVGCIIALATLADVISTEEALRILRARAARGYRTEAEQEHNLGDYSPGRYALALEDVRPLSKPLICRGYQGMFPLPDADAAEVRRLAR